MRRGWMLIAAWLGLCSWVRADDRTGSSESTLASLQQEEQGLRGELESLNAREQECRRRFVLRGRAMYRLVRVGILPVGGGFGALFDHAVRVERARRALDQDVSEYRRATERKTALLRKLDEIAARRGPLELELEAATRARAILQQAEDRKRAFDRAFETSTGAGDYVAVYGGGLGGLAGPEGAAPAGGGFRSMKGTLPFPLAGRAEVRKARRPGGSGPGLELAAPPGTPVLAVFPGRVAFADRYDPFGQVVILDHGDHYYTMMGDLGSIEVRVGDDLSVGARVGTVGFGAREEGAPSGSAAGGRAPGLYFEIRHAQTTVDPGPWLGL